MSHEEPPTTLIEFCWERSLPEQSKQVKRWKSLIGFLDLAHFGSIFNQKKHVICHEYHPKWFLCTQ